MWCLETPGRDGGAFIAGGTSSPHARVRRRYRCGPALAACTALLGECAPAASVRELTLDTQEFGRAELEVDRLVIRAGAHVRVRDGALLWIRARSVRIEGDAVIDASGIPGADMGEWVSSGDCATAHRDFATAQFDLATQSGGAGGLGGWIEIRYHDMEPGSLAWDRVRFDVQGGQGGRGLVLRCGCAAHSQEVRQAPSGDSGQPGGALVLRE